MARILHYLQSLVTKVLLLDKIKILGGFIMKKIVLTVVSILALGAGTAFAGTPINNLNQGQTAIGVQDHDLYIQHQLTNNLSLGLSENDINGQIGLGNNVRGIIGSRDYQGSSEIYAGAVFVAPLAPSLDGYASLVGASEFTEAQVGANYNLTSNLDINLNYRSFMPDQGGNSNRTSLGAAFKF